MRPCAVSLNTLHISFALTSLNGGGAERSILNLARSLIERGHRADLVIPRFAGDYRADVPRGMPVYRARLPHTDRKLLRQIRRAGVEVEALTVNPFGVACSWRVLDRRFPVLSGVRRHRVYAYAHMIAKYIRESAPDVVVSALPGADAAVACAAELTDRSVPTVITVHTNVARGYPPQWRAVAQTLYPLASAVVGVSRGVSASISRTLGVDPEFVHCIYNGIPVDHVRHLATEQVAHSWFMQGEPPVVLSVGRETPAKDHTTLVRAFGLARCEVSARLLILGRFSSRCREQLRSIADGFGVEQDIGFLDFDENPYRYMMRSGPACTFFPLGGPADGNPRGAGLWDAGREHRHALRASGDTGLLGRVAAGRRRHGSRERDGRSVARRETNGASSPRARQRLLVRKGR